MGHDMNENGNLKYNPETGVFQNSKGRTVGYKANQWGYIAVYRAGKAILAHRLAWFLHYGVWPDGRVDHINGDPADNRICNLRLATPSENRANSRVNKNNKSGIKGVQFRHGRWRAKITRAGVSHHIGTFDCPAAASNAYAKAARALHGEFARAA